jgi:uncharacterized protein (UPF0548 family)
MTRNQKIKHAATAAVLSIASQAHAAVDVSATTAELALVAAAVLLVGIAVLNIEIGVRLYKWVRKAL